MKPVSLEEAEYVAHNLAKKLMNYDEPMPEFNTRFSGKLEACLMQPFQTGAGRQLYSGYSKKAAMLFYCVVKDHPFINGNKRMAVMLTLVFFFVNKRWLNVSPHILYKIACDVAESTPDNRHAILKALDEFFTKYTTVNK